MTIPAVLLALGLPAFAGGRSEAVSAAPADQNQEMTPEEVKDGLAKLDKYLEKRGEDVAVADEFLSELKRRALGKSGEQADSVTRKTFAAFLKYEEAWVRKTRDAKNPKVSPDQLKHERERAKVLRKTFVADAQKDSPRFYAAYRAAVNEVKRANADKLGKGKGATAFFADNPDDSYSQVDAGDEALDQGDTAAAVAVANQAIAENPGNADAFALKSGAELMAGDPAAAAHDAQTALSLDPGNQQAQAVASLAAPSAASLPSAGTYTDATNLSGQIAGDGSGAANPSASPAAAVSLAPPTQAPAPPPAVLPILSQDLSDRLTQKAADSAATNPSAALGNLSQAIALNPGNADALNWQSAVYNRRSDFRDALTSADAALKVNPNSALAHLNRARALNGLGDRAGALDMLRAAAAEDAMLNTAAQTAAALPPQADLSSVITDALMDEAMSSPNRKHHHWPRKKSRELAWPVELMAAIGLLMLIVGMFNLRRR